MEHEDPFIPEASVPDQNSKCLPHLSCIPSVDPTLYLLLILFCSNCSSCKTLVGCVARLRTYVSSCLHEYPAKHTNKQTYAHSFFLSPLVYSKEDAVLCCISPSYTNEQMLLSGCIGSFFPSAFQTTLSFYPIDLRSHSAYLQPDRLFNNCRVSKSAVRRS